MASFIDSLQYIENKPLAESILCGYNALFEGAETAKPKPTLLQILVSYLDEQRKLWDKTYLPLTDIIKQKAQTFPNLGSLNPKEMTKVVNEYYSSIDEYRFLTELLGQNVQMRDLDRNPSQHIAQLIIAKIKQNPDACLVSFTDKSRVSKLRLFAYTAAAILKKQQK